MSFEEATCNGDGMECIQGVQFLKSKAVASACEVTVIRNSGNGSTSTREGFLTYKRRRYAGQSLGSKVLGCGRNSVEAASQLAGQMPKGPQDMLLDNSCEQACLPGKKSCAFLNGSKEFSQLKWKNVVLEHVYQSLSADEEGVRRCIRDALVYCPGTDHTMKIKESGVCDIIENGCTSQSGRMPNGTQYRDKNPEAAISNGSSDESKCCTVTEMCQQVFYNIIVSEKFTLLCKLLLENFQGIKAESLFCMHTIDSKMKEGVYEHSPELFLMDIQQMWRKFEGIGHEMVYLAKSLSDMSKDSYSEEIGCSVPHRRGEEKDKFCAQESVPHAKLEHPAAYSVYRICTCKQCGKEADGKDCLVCDSCEEMYHVSCIEPAVKEIPPRSWYCAKCTASGIGSPHENCVVCEKVNAPRTLISHGVNDISPTNGEPFYEIEENSNGSMENGLQMSEESKNNSMCKVCGGEVEDGEKFRMCGHSFCVSKYYHTRCLTTKQLKSYAACWYCPSCLCRICLNDKDDDKIVLCDGCDDAYHIYCMKPPRTSIPRGKWFCRKCDGGIQRIRKAKRAFEKFENKQKQRGGDSEKENEVSEKQQCENEKEESDKGRGGMDMLLSAANTLNYEEKMAAIQIKN